jgi:predicted glycosyltransferase
MCGKVSSSIRVENFCNDTLINDKVSLGLQRYVDSLLQLIEEAGSHRNLRDVIHR